MRERREKVIKRRGGVRRARARACGRGDGEGGEDAHNSAKRRGFVWRTDPRRELLVRGGDCRAQPARCAPSESEHERGGLRVPGIREFSLYPAAGLHQLQNTQLIKIYKPSTTTIL